MAEKESKENDQVESGRPTLDQVEQADKPLDLDPFNPENLRLRGVESLGVEKVLTTVPCDKPKAQQFVRVHPDESYRMETAIFEDKIQKEIYLVSPSMLPQMSSDITPVCLFTAVTRHNDCFLWPVKLPGQDGRTNSWNESAMAAAKLAMENWVRVTSSMSASKYEVFKAIGNLPDPEWPTETFQELLRRCFENRFIDSVDREILKSLRGEV